MDYKKKLEKDKENVSKLIKEMEDNTLFGDTVKHTSEKYSTGELSSVDNHIADLGTDVYMEDMNNSLVDHEKYVLDGINNALKNIDNGTYGVCVKCHRKIEPERLELIPETTLCAICAKEEIQPPDASEDMDKNAINSNDDIYYSEHLTELTDLNKTDEDDYCN